MKLAFISLVGVFAAMSCGGASNGDKGSKAAPGPDGETASQLSAADEQIVAQEFKSIPDAVIIRVPLNADGTEDEANASMRTYSGAPIENNDAALNAYTSLAKDVGSMVENELDADSSTSSWQSFRPGNGHQGGYPNSSNQTQYYNNTQSTSLDLDYAGFGQRLSLQYQNTQSTTTYQSNSRIGGGGYGGGHGGGHGGGNCGGGNCGGGYGQSNYYSNYRPFYHSGIGRSYGWHYNQARRWVAGNCNYYVYPRY